MPPVVRETCTDVVSFFLMDREQTCSCFRLCFVKRILRQMLYSLLGRLQLTCVSLFVVVILIVTVFVVWSSCSRHDSVYYEIFFPHQCCGVVDVTSCGALHSASKRKRERRDQRGSEFETRPAGRIPASRGSFHKTDC